MPKRSGAESGAGGGSSHRGGAGHAGAGAQSGAGNSKKNPVGRKKSSSGPKKSLTAAGARPAACRSVSRPFHAKDPVHLVFASCD
jgi:hypothetical protein